MLMLQKKIKKKEEEKKKRSSDDAAGYNKYRYLIVVNVVGGSGPVRFLVNEDDLVYGVINTALKSYASQGRLPPLGTQPQHFLLYCISGGSSQALSPLEPIGSSGGRNFVLCKKQIQQQQPQTMEAAADQEEIAQKYGCCFCWKSCLMKNLINLKMLCHG